MNIYNKSKELIYMPDMPGIEDEELSKIENYLGELLDRFHQIREDALTRLYFDGEKWGFANQSFHLMGSLSTFNAIEDSFFELFCDDPEYSPLKMEFQKKSLREFEGSLRMILESYRIIYDDSDVMIFFAKERENSGWGLITDRVFSSVVPSLEALYQRVMGCYEEPACYD